MNGELRFVPLNSPAVFWAVCTAALVGKHGIVLQNEKTMCEILRDIDSFVIIALEEIGGPLPKGLGIRTQVYRYVKNPALDNMDKLRLGVHGLVV